MDERVAPLEGRGMEKALCRDDGVVRELGGCSLEIW